MNLSGWVVCFRRKGIASIRSCAYLPMFWPFRHIAAIVRYLLLKRRSGLSGLNRHTPFAFPSNQNPLSGLSTFSQVFVYSSPQPPCTPIPVSLLESSCPTLRFWTGKRNCAVPLELLLESVSVGGGGGLNRAIEIDSNPSTHDHHEARS